MNQVKKTFELITLITLTSTLTATINIKKININNLGSVFKSSLGNHHSHSAYHNVRKQTIFIIKKRNKQWNIKLALRFLPINWQILAYRQHLG